MFLGAGEKLGIKKFRSCNIVDLKYGSTNALTSLIKNSGGGLSLLLPLIHPCDLSLDPQLQFSALFETLMHNQVMQ